MFMQHAFEQLSEFITAQRSLQASNDQFLCGNYTNILHCLRKRKVVCRPETCIHASSPLHNGGLYTWRVIPPSTGALANFTWNVTILDHQCMLIVGPTCRVAQSVLHVCCIFCVCVLPGQTQHRSFLCGFCMIYILFTCIHLLALALQKKWNLKNVIYCCDKNYINCLYI